MADAYQDNRWDESGAAPRRWSPSPALNGRLFTGAMAILFAGGMAATGAYWQVVQGRAPGFMTILGLDLGSIPPLFLVLGCYLGLAKEVESRGLKRSSIGFIGALVLGQFVDLAELPGTPGWWSVMVWSLTGIGLIGLLFAVFSFTKSNGPQKADGSGSEPTKAGCGGLVVVLLIFIKIGAKVLILAGIKNLKAEGVESLVSIALLICTAVFLIWFGVTKIRLRSQLGGMAALTGATELLALIAGVIFAVCYAADIIQLDQQPNVQDADLVQHREQWWNWLCLGLAATHLLWAGMTSWFFLSLRNRFDPDAGWLDDDAMEAEKAY